LSKELLIHTYSKCLTAALIIFLQLFYQDHNFQKDVNKHKIFDSMV